MYRPPHAPVPPKPQLHIPSTGETSSEIPFDAAAASVQSAINSLSSVYPSRVDVTRTEETIDRSQQVGGYTWTVVFDSDTWHDPTDHSPSETYIDGSWIGDAAGWTDTWPSTGEGRFSKAWGRNVGRLPDMDCSSDGLGTTRGDGSEDCKVLYHHKIVAVAFVNLTEEQLVDCGMINFDSG